MRWSRVLIAVLGAVLVFSTTQARPRARQSTLGELVPVRPELTAVLMRSCLPLVVDIYWLRAINAVGTTQTEAEARNLAEYGRVLTTLDPDFYTPYWLLGIYIPFNRDREDWVNGDVAVELLQKGTARFPTDLRLKLLLGYSLMTFTTRYVEAAKTFEEASHLPKAPDFAALLATRLYLKGDQYDTALSMARAMSQSAATEEERARFDDRVKELLDEKVLRQIDAAAAAFKEKFGRMPGDLQELVGSGFLARPEDERFWLVRFDTLGRTLLPESKGRLKVFHDSFGGRDDDAPETWR